MGNYRFRLSDMIPNAWFYKLKDMNRHNKINHRKNITSNPMTKIKKQSSSSSSSPPPPASSLPSSASSSLSSSSSSTSSAPPQNHLAQQRKSYHFTRDFTNSSQESPRKATLIIPEKDDLVAEPPRKSARSRRSTKKNRRPRLVSSSISAGCSCRATLESVVSAKPGLESPDSSSGPDSVITEYGSGRLSWSSSCKCRTDHQNDIVFDIDHDDKPFNDLPPIITKINDDDDPTKITKTLSIKVVKEEFGAAAAAKSAQSPVVRRVFSGNSASPGVKLRTNSPRIGSRRIHGGGRKSLSSSSSAAARRSISESLAVVKSSRDPRRDFRESMVEMILENNIRASNDLEELLACYLSLNSDEYHDLIINVFKQIWFDFIHLRIK